MQRLSSVLDSIIISVISILQAQISGFIRPYSRVHKIPLQTGFLLFQWKNRYQNALTVCDVALDSIVSDIFRKSATSVIDYLIEQSNNSINHEEITYGLIRSLKKVWQCHWIHWRVSDDWFPKISYAPSVLYRR